MLLGPAIVDKPKNQPNDAECPCDDKGTAPTDQHDQSGHRNGNNNVADIGAGVEKAGCQGALTLGKPLGDGLDAGGKVGCFSEAEHEHGNAKVMTENAA